MTLLHSYTSIVSLSMKHYFEANWFWRVYLTAVMLYQRISIHSFPYFLPALLSSSSILHFMHSLFFKHEPWSTSTRIPQICRPIRWKSCMHQRLAQSASRICHQLYPDQSRENILSNEVKNLANSLHKSQSPASIALVNSRTVSCHKLYSSRDCGSDCYLTTIP